MLRTRIFTALVLLPLVVAGILWLPTAAVAAILAAVLLVGAWEWSRLVRLVSPAAQAVPVLATAAAFASLWWLGLPFWAVAAVLVPAVLWWCLAVFWILRFPRVWDLGAGSRTAGVALGLLLLAAPFVALVVLHQGERGAVLMLLLFVLIWAADTGAYFAGHWWGRHKLVPRVSPGKTYEGAVGGVVLALAVAILGGLALDYEGARLAAFMVLGGVTAAVSIVGDLTVSMFKRQAGVKDSGTFFPGHGGVLDRLDSLLAAAPVFVLGLGWIA